MTEMNNCQERSIILGQDLNNNAILKMLDVLCDDKGHDKSIRNKTSEKLLNADSLDYLKSQYRVQTDDVSLLNTDSVTKNIKRNCKRKLYPLSCQLMGRKDNFVLCLSPLVDCTKVAKGLELSRWFSRKLIANSFVNTNEIECQEVPIIPCHIKSEVIYVSPNFYKSQEFMVINTKNILFNLYLKEWFKIELLYEYVKSITIFANRPFIKVTIKDKIADEISKLYQKYDMNISDIYRGTQKKGLLYKEVMIVFTSNQLSKSDFCQIVDIVGVDKMVWNESEIEATEILDNILMKNPNKLEIINSHGKTNWSLIFKPDCNLKVAVCSKRNSTPFSLTNTQSSHLTINNDKSHLAPILQSVNQVQSSPIPVHNMAKMQQSNLTKGNVIAIQPAPPLVSTPKATKIRPSVTSTRTPKTSKKHTKQPISTNKVMNIQPQPPTTSTPTNVPIVSPTKLSSPSQGLINYIVTTSAPAVNFDSISNIFHRICNNSQSIIPYKLSSLSPNISVAALNQFIANGTRPNQQSVISLPVLLNTEGTTTSTNNVVTKPVENTDLMYIQSRNLNNVFETFHYSPSPRSDVLIHGSDLLCLNFGQYLNDNIINFYLNFIRYEIMSEDQRQRTHLFNVFFNTKLQGSLSNSDIDTPEIRHARVAKWTKKVDIFDKDFIIIPICENQHWFLAIVCFPWMAGMISYEQLLGNNEEAVNEIPVNVSKFAKIDRVNRVKRLRKEYNVEPSPCILLFDSLQYVSRAPNVKLIREYLKTEWDSKRKTIDGALVFDKNTVRGFNPQVPQQTNHIDCGIFVLHYVEQFFVNPLPVFTKEYFQSSLLTWFKSETVANKRSAIQNMLLSKADAAATYQVQCEATLSRINSQQSTTMTTTNLQQSYDDSGSDIQIL